MRSLLFAPGNVPTVLAKLPRSGPDGAVLDLEDAVPEGAKADARRIVQDAATDLVGAHPELAVHVRVNAVASEWFATDVAEALVPGLAGVVVPKLESAEQVAAVLAALDAAGHRELPVVAGLETAAGVARAEEVLGHDRVPVAYFGAEDYVADVGGVRTAGGTEVLYARSRVALAARLTGTVAVDQVVTAFGDDDAFVADAEQGRALGYRGKLCIHPAQVALAHRVFSPSEEELDRARRLLTAYERAVDEGRAAIAFEGQMVDEPLARQARAIVNSAEDR